MSDTPRTDAHNWNEGHYDDPLHSLLDFAKQLERELNAANDRIKRLEEVTQERDKEWFQVIESILGFHPVSMTEALRIGIERIKKQKQRIKRLEEFVEQLTNPKFTRDDLPKEALLQYIKRLEEAGGEVANILSSNTPDVNCSCHLSAPCSDCVDHGASREALADWTKAKEAKP